MRRSSGSTSSRIRPRTVSALLESVRQLRPRGRAVRLRLLAPHAEERSHDAVLTARLDPGRGAARDEAEEDRLDLVGERVAGRAQQLGLLGVAQVAQLGLGRAGRAHDAGAEALGAPARVVVRLRAAQPVIDVERRDLVAELARARGRGRSSRRRPRRGSARLRPARSARAGGRATRSAPGAPGRQCYRSSDTSHPSARS